MNIKLDCISLQVQRRNRKCLEQQQHHRQPFKLMVKKSMSQQVQKHLDSVVGLMKNGLANVFRTHPSSRGTMSHRKKRIWRTEWTAGKNWTQLQLEKLSKQKKEKDKVQAPMMTATPQPPVKDEVAQVTHIAPVSAPSIPPIHVHVNQPRDNYCPP